MNISNRMEGVYEIRHFRKGEEVCQPIRVDNQILTSAYQYFDTGLKLNDKNSLSIGSGTTANTTNTTDVTIPLEYSNYSFTNNPIKSASISSRKVLTIVSSTTFTLTVTDGGNLAEVAIKGFSRALLNSVRSVNAGDVLTITYTLTVSFGRQTGIPTSSTDHNNKTSNFNVSITPMFLSSKSSISYTWSELFSTYQWFSELKPVTTPTYSPTSNSVATLNGWADSHTDTQTVDLVGRLMNQDSTNHDIQAFFIGNGFFGFLVDLSANPITAVPNSMLMPKFTVQPSF